MSYSIFKSQADPLALGRSELIQAICSCHQEDSCVIDGKFGEFQLNLLLRENKRLLMFYLIVR